MASPTNAQRLHAEITRLVVVVQLDDPPSVRTVASRLVTLLPYCDPRVWAPNAKI
jgi:hypothetical protein